MSNSSINNILEELSIYFLQTEYDEWNRIKWDGIIESLAGEGGEVNLFSFMCGASDKDLDLLNRLLIVVKTNGVEFLKPLINEISQFS
ncbi:hypothetical protein AB835_08135 [Candidatus Endobugula sertula]|uniref:Uncharacterized protein n=1 Tax=Candidatus Endobugula sertula TaxID=62101 RepID=A0A1D2QPT2_9GAMM|nr:hypothetical protein AB835_08135 [Candidatus Endobugula sertula]